MTMLTDSAVHVALDALAAAIDRVSVHSADPGTTGANELSGGTYARVTPTWAAASSRKVANSVAMVHNAPAGSTGAFYGFWTNTGSIFRGWAPIGGSVRGFATVDGTDVAADTLSSNGHGLVVDNRVLVEPVNAEALPTGLTRGVIYWVKTVPDVDNFTLSTTQGGAAVDITGKGELLFMQCAPEVFASAGTLTAAIGAVTIDASLVAN